jgi:hypothetical protein
MSLTGPYSGPSNTRLTALINQDNNTNRIEGVDFTYGAPSSFSGPGGVNTKVTLTPLAGTQYYGPQDAFYHRLPISVLADLPGTLRRSIVVTALPFTLHSILSEINAALRLNLTTQEVINQTFSDERDNYPLTIDETRSLAWAGGVFQIPTILNINGIPLHQAVGNSKLNGYEEAPDPNIDIGLNFTSRKLPGFEAIEFTMSATIGAKLDGFIEQEYDLADIIEHQALYGFKLLDEQLQSAVGRHGLQGYVAETFTLAHDIATPKLIGWTVAPSDLGTTINGSKLMGFAFNTPRLSEILPSKLNGYDTSDISLPLSFPTHKLNGFEARLDSDEQIGLGYLLGTYLGGMYNFGATTTVDVTEGDLPLTVSFTSTAYGYTSGLLWEFGDGETSTAQNPTHVYNSPGNKTVVLNVYSADGTQINRIVKKNLVNVIGGVAVTASITTAGSSVFSLALGDVVDVTIATLNSDYSLPLSALHTDSALSAIPITYTEPTTTGPVTIWVDLVGQRIVLRGKLSIAQVNISAIVATNGAYVINSVNNQFVANVPLRLQTQNTVFDMVTWHGPFAFGTPYVAYDSGAASILFHPGPDDQRAILQWTNTFENGGSFSVHWTGTEDSQINDSNMEMWVNGVLHHTIIGGVGSYDTTLTLALGDTIEIQQTAHHPDGSISYGGAGKYVVLQITQQSNNHQWDSYLDYFNAHGYKVQPWDYFWRESPSNGSVRHEFT